MLCTVRQSIRFDLEAGKKEKHTADGDAFEYRFHVVVGES